MAAKFLEGEKGASFAKAFSKILEHKTKQPKPASADAPAGGKGAAPAGLAEGPILAVRDAYRLPIISLSFILSPQLAAVYLRFSSHSVSPGAL